MLSSGSDFMLSNLPFVKHGGLSSSYDTNQHPATPLTHIFTDHTPKQQDTQNQLMTQRAAVSAGNTFQDLLWITPNATYNVIFM
jgi:hypothetical protein